MPYRWEQQASESPLSYDLTIDDGSVIMEVTVACSPTRETSGFKEGLWQEDVVELFLNSPNSAGYYEYNFAAGGAWWSASFAGPRKQIEERPESVEILDSGFSSASWWFTARLLGVGYEDSLVGNVCGIFGTQPRRYASLFPLAQTIDFHRPECFQELGV